MPVFFPAVEQGAPFAFVIAPTRRICSGLLSDLPIAADRLLALARDCLIEALEVHGIGAKTAAGYGWFEQDAELSRDREAELRKKEQSEKARHEREARLAAMTPEARRAEELGQMPDEEFKGRIRDLGQADVDEQRAMLLALCGPKAHIWEADSRVAKKKKGAKRVALVREVASKLGVKMP